MAIGIESVGGVSGVSGVSAVARTLAAALRDGLPVAGAAGRLLAGAGGDASAASSAATASAGAMPPPAALLPGSPSSGAPMLGSVQMLVALASLSAGEIRRRERIARAGRGVQALERLHRAVQAGRVDEPTLAELAEWAGRWAEEQAAPGESPAETAADADLTALMEAIDLRVRVELAKFDISV